MRPYFGPQTAVRPFLLRSPRCNAAQTRPFESGLQRRSFHPSRPHQILDTGVTLAHGLLQGVHSVSGLSWALSIPLTAVAVRMTFGFTQQWWSRSQSLKKSRLTPMLTAWRTIHQKRIQESYSQNKAAITPVVANKLVFNDLKKTESEIYKRWGIKRWAPFVFLTQVPIFLSMIEALRMMVDTNIGLLGYMADWMGSKSETVFPVESSMATEGALWFPDLLANDSTFLLPLLLSGTIFTNVTWGSKRASKREILEMSGRSALKARAMNALRTILQVFAVCIFPAACQMPSGILIYWISSSVVATAQTKFLSIMRRPFPVPRECHQRRIGSIHDDAIYTGKTGNSTRKQGIDSIVV